MSSAGSTSSLYALGNLTISVAYLGIAGAILVPLVRARQVRANRLGTATAAIFFSCAVGHGLMGLDPLLPLVAGSARSAAARRSAVTFQVGWDLLTACVAIYYWTLRRTYRELMRGAVLFEDLREQQRVTALEAATDLAAARADADQQRAVQEQLHREVLASLDEGVLTVAADGSVLYANPAALRLLGPTVDPTTGTAYRTPHWDAVDSDGVPVPPERRPTAAALRTGTRQQAAVSGSSTPPARGAGCRSAPTRCVDPGRTPPTPRSPRSPTCPSDARRRRSAGRQPRRLRLLVTPQWQPRRRSRRSWPP